MILPILERCWVKSWKQLVSRIQKVLHHLSNTDSKIIIAGGENDPTECIGQWYSGGPFTRLKDSSGKNPSYYCNYCDMEFQPESENLRRVSKLSVPLRDTETLIAHSPAIDYRNVQIHRTLTYKLRINLITVPLGNIEFMIVTSPT
jgi:hypothetical protein